MSSDAFDNVLFLLALGAIGYAAIRVFEEASFGEPSPDDFEDYPALTPAFSGAFEMTQTANMFPPSQLTMSERGKTLLMQHEGFRREAYRDSAGKLTIGIGHLVQPTDGIDEKTVLTDGQVQQLFVGDLANAENAVRRLIGVPITQGMFDALTDFAFQYGYTRLQGSTLRVLLQNREYDRAALEFAKWVHVTDPATGQKVVSAGVQARQRDNTQTFLT